MTEDNQHRPAPLASRPDPRLRVLGVATIVAAAAGAIFATTPAIEEPEPPVARCQDRQVATAWLVERCAEDLFAEER